MAKKLEAYNEKRRFDKTDEPAGEELDGSAESGSAGSAAESGKSPRRLRFVVQHHVASRDHYDFRLEMDGVLKSWAVPKGPSFNTRDKRLAIQVEDHPFDYRNFEGTIPKGEYGGGTVMIWDEGFWEPFGDSLKELEGGSLKFRLYGKRLRGKWALVHMKPRGNEKDRNWLLIKEKDAYANISDIDRFTTSATTDRTMEEIAAGKQAQSLEQADGGTESSNAAGSAPSSKSNASQESTSPAKKQLAPKQDFGELILHGVKITHPEKVAFPDANVRKGDVANYYSKVAERMLPYIENRLLSSVRCPQGIEKPCFFRKHPATAGKGVGTLYLGDKDGGSKGSEPVGVPSSTSPSSKTTGKKSDQYFYIKNVSGLMSEVQLNTLEFHPWGSNVDTLEHPDTMIFDLDPDSGMKLDTVRQGVLDVKAMLDKLSLTSFVKTSGGKGYHVVVPFRPAGSWSTFKGFAQNAAKLLEAMWPDRYTSNSRKSERHARIYVDWQRNIRGATSVAPYSLRAREAVTVSMPISWEELYTVTPNQITLDDALDRLHLSDPWEHYFKVDQELKID